MKSDLYPFLDKSSEVLKPSALNPMFNRREDQTWYRCPTLKVCCTACWHPLWLLRQSEFERFRQPVTRATAARCETSSESPRSCRLLFSGKAQIDLTGSAGPERQSVSLSEPEAASILVAAKTPKISARQSREARSPYRWISAG